MDWGDTLKGDFLTSIILGREKYLYPAFAVALLLFAYRSYEWLGVAFLISGAVTWALLHYSRVVQVFKKAANRPIGYVGSAVMVYSRLKKGQSLLHVIALTKSLGKSQIPHVDGEQKTVFREVFDWTDGSDSTVRCVFENGKLVSFDLARPPQE